MLKEDKDPLSLADTLCGHVITCDEIGCGIVPLEKSDRDYRENVGRIMCRVVERAEHVERLICGIPQRLK